MQGSFKFYLIHETVTTRVWKLGSLFLFMTWIHSLFIHPWFKKSYWTPSPMNRFIPKQQAKGAHVNAFMQTSLPNSLIYKPPTEDHWNMLWNPALKSVWRLNDFSSTNQKRKINSYNLGNTSVLERILWESSKWVMMCRERSQKSEQKWLKD